MAKKVKKAKPAKKAAKPAKKAAKKAAKPAKKAKNVKKVAKKSSKPAKKKIIAKKAVKKAAPKKAAKKAIAKKPAAKKVVKVKKLAKAKSVKKVVAKKPLAKAASRKPAPVKVAVKKAVEKPEVKKPVAVVPPPVAKPVIPAAKVKPVVKKKEESILDDEDDGSANQERYFDLPTPVIKRYDANQPKPQINKDKRTRYTDKELQEFKQLILEKIAEAKKDYELLKSTLSHKDDHGTDDTSPTFKLLEDGSDVLSKEETAQLAARQEKFIQNLQNALIRIENKTYGICRVTGKLISKERLRSVPHATLGIDAKLGQTV